MTYCEGALFSNLFPYSLRAGSKMFLVCCQLNLSQCYKAGSLPCMYSRDALPQHGLFVGHFLRGWPSPFPAQDPATINQTIYTNCPKSPEVEILFIKTRLFLEKMTKTFVVSKHLCYCLRFIMEVGLVWDSSIITVFTLSDGLGWGFTVFAFSFNLRMIRGSNIISSC